MAGGDDGVAPVGLAVLMTVALRFSLPAGSAYPLLAMLAAGLVWFGVTRVSEPPWRAARRDDVRGGRGDGVRDGRGGYRSGDRAGDRDDYWPDETYRPWDDHVPDGQYATYGPRGGMPWARTPPGEPATFRAVVPRPAPLTAATRAGA